jgi:hypothetical protein
MQTKQLARICSIALMLFLGACATLPQQSYNREANAGIKRIQVLTMPKANVRLHVANPTGANFGLIGALITEANRNGKENWLQDTVAKTDFDQFAALKATFDAEMQAKGYELIWPDALVDDGKKVKRDALSLRKSYSSSDADAQLDLGFMYVGYAAAGSGSGQPYRPTVEMSMRMVGSDGKTVLFTDQIRYHNVLGNQQAIILEPDANFTYPKFSDLEAADTGCIDGLRIAVEETARAMARQL